MKSFMTTDAEGNELELELKDYNEFIVKTFEVKEVTSETQGVIPPKKVVGYIIKTLAEDKELDPSISDNSDLAEAIAKIKEDIANTKKNASSAKEKAAEEKAAKEAAKAKEKEEAALKKAEAEKTQLAFNTKVNEGYDKAVAEFSDEVDDLKAGLPTTMTIGKSGAGFGIQIGENATADDIANGLGYLFGKAEGSKWLGNQLQFLVGDLASASIAKGIYPDSLAASKAISAFLETQGKRMSPNSIDVYRRLADRTPPEVRNPRVDPTAFLAISQVNPNPKQMDGESKEAFAARKESLATDLRTLQEELRDGKILTRKDIGPKVLEAEYKNGLKVRPDPNKENLSPGKLLANFFLATIAIDHLDGLNAEPGTVVFLAEDGTNKVEVPVSQLEALREEAKSNLLNIYFETKKVTAKDFLRGHKIVEKEVAMGTGADGKAITEKQQVKDPVYYPIFFKIEEEGAAEETAEPEAPAEKKPATKKAAKTKA